MPSVSKFFKREKEPKLKKATKTNGAPKLEAPRKRWDDAWQRTSVDPEEVQELLRGCTREIKARALEVPFLILPFRPASDPSAAKSFIRNFFGDGHDPSRQPSGERLIQELRMVEPLVLCSVVKWCWSRLPGGVVTWEAYELFNIGEKDSKQAQDAFNTFIPLSVGSAAREKIIYDFFELLAAMAANGKTNGLGGRKLSRHAGWWAFDHTETTKGFEGGYKNWEKAADACSHLFFAYLRSLTTAAPTTQERSGVNLLPRALETLLDATEYPPVPQAKLQNRASKVVMIVEHVSPTPFTLLKRAGNFQYREEDHILQRFSDFEEPTDALTDECRRVLKSISSTNDSSSAKVSTSLKDPSWSRFEDMGFGNLTEESDTEQPAELSKPVAHTQRLRSAPQTLGRAGGRPMTPSWGDFLSTGFSDDKGATTLLPPDKQLPPIGTQRERAISSQSHRASLDNSLQDRGELANITRIEFDSAFWWTWMTSLAGEEPAKRKAAFGRCALIETRIYGGCWLLMEEIVKGAAPEPGKGAYVAEKKSKFSLRGLTRSKSSAKNANLPKGQNLGRGALPEQEEPNRPALDKEQHARIQAAAAALQERNRKDDPMTSLGRGEETSQKTQSIMTLQSAMIKDATPAMQWARSYDKQTMRAKYLGNDFAGTGAAVDLKEVLGAGGLTPVTEQKPPTPPKDTTEKQPSDSRDGLPPRDSSLRTTPQPVAEDQPPPTPAKDEFIKPVTPPKDFAKPATPPREPAKPVTPPKEVSKSQTGSQSPQAKSFFRSHLPPDARPAPSREASETVVPQPPPKEQSPPKALAPPKETAPPPPPQQEKPAPRQEAVARPQKEPERAPKKESSSKAKYAALRPLGPRKKESKEMGESTKKPTLKSAAIAAGPERAAPQPPAPVPAQSAEPTLNADPTPEAEPAPQTEPVPPVESSKPEPVPKDEPAPPPKEEAPVVLEKVEPKPPVEVTKTSSRTEEPPTVSEASEAPATPEKSIQSAAETPSTGATSVDSKGDRNRLQKKTKGDRLGIKAMFGRKKVEEEKKPAAPPPAKPAASSSVAAARAALEAKAKENQAPSPSPQPRVTAKRISTVGGKEAAAEKTASPPPDKTASRSDGKAAVTAGKPPPRGDSKGAADRPVSTAESSTIDPAEEQRAHEAFSTFDQGMPEGHQSSGALSEKHDEPEQETPRPAPAQIAVQQKEKEPEPTAESTVPAEKTEAVKAAEAQKDAPASPEAVGDRWAQIRKNAAERAARMSEDKDGRNARNDDDDDETDEGEESIESRVARIKARVAELTGNMDPPKKA